MKVIESNLGILSHDPMLALSSVKCVPMSFLLSNLHALKHYFSINHLTERGLLINWFFSESVGYSGFRIMLEIFLHDPDAPYKII